MIAGVRLKLFEHCAVGGGGHQRAVTFQISLHGFFVRHKVFQPRVDLFLRHAEVDFALFNVDVDDVAFLHDADHAACRRFGADVPDRRAARRAREPSVRDERNGSHG